MAFWDTKKNGDPFHDDPFFNPWAFGGAFNNPTRHHPSRNPEVEAYAEKMVRDEWQRKLKAHGDSKCSLCGHSGWCHGAKGCVAFRAGTPTKIITMGRIEVPVVDIPDDAKIQDFFCGCNGELCKTNHEIIWGEKEQPGGNDGL
jgi:hypothetical protein